MHILLSSTKVHIDDKEFYGRTSLWCASAAGKESTVELLLDKYGGNADLEDKLGRTPRSIAVKRRHHAVVELFDKRYGSNDRGTLDRTETLNTIRTTKTRDASELRCIVCTVIFWTHTCHYHCDSCADRQFDICADCVESGASCMDTTHKLIKREWDDGSWVVQTT
jgi:hypothetical protein